MINLSWLDGINHFGIAEDDIQCPVQPDFSLVAKFMKLSYHKPNTLNWALTSFGLDRRIRDSAWSLPSLGLVAP